MKLRLLFVAMLLTILSAPTAARGQEVSGAPIPNDPLGRTFTQVMQELLDWDAAVAAAQEAGVVGAAPSISSGTDAPPGSPRWEAERGAHAAWVAQVQAFRDSGGILTTPASEDAGAADGSPSGEGETADSAPSLENPDEQTIPMETPGS